MSPALLSSPCNYWQSLKLQSGVSCCVQKVERLRSQLHFIGAAAPRQHVVFVDDEAAAQSFSAQQHFDTPNELLGRSFNRPRTAQLQEPTPAANISTGHRQQRAERLVIQTDQFFVLVPLASMAAKKVTSAHSTDFQMCRKREASYKELQQRHERHHNLSQMAGSTVMQKAIMVMLCVDALCPQTLTSRSDMSGQSRSRFHKHLLAAVKRTKTEVAAI